LRDHPLFHSKIQYYSARDKKMIVGLYTITPEKLITIFQILAFLNLGWLENSSKK
jgi:hypothetical protein